MQEGGESRVYVGHTTMAELSACGQHIISSCSQTRQLFTMVRESVPSTQDVVLLRQARGHCCMFMIRIVMPMLAAACIAVSRGRFPLPVLFLCQDVHGIYMRECCTSCSYLCGIEFRGMYGETMQC
jgi:hypothetical protein